MLTMLEQAETTPNAYESSFDSASTEPVAAITPESVILTTTEPTPALEPVDGNAYYAYALHAFMKTKLEREMDDEAGGVSAVLHDIDGCGSVEMIIVDEGIPDAEDFWGAYAIGFGMYIYDVKYPGKGESFFVLDEVTHATYKVYITNQNDLVVYDSFEGEVYRVFAYSNGTLSQEVVFIDANRNPETGEQHYFVNGMECSEVHFFQQLNEHGLANIDSVSFMISEGWMGWTNPFDELIPAKSDIDRIIDFESFE